jgi:cell division protein FtsZ
MVESGIEGVQMICANTDEQALDTNLAELKITLGTGISNGLGAGGKPEVGRDAALDDLERIKTLLEGSDMVFVAAGMGGGTGTGAAPIVARAAKEIGALTVAVVTKPLELEMRDQIADVGLKELTDEVDSLIAIPNQKLLEVLGREHSLLDAFKQANDVLLGAVRGISDIITQTGLVNVDFQDVKTVMSEKGTAMMGTGIANGPSRAKEAASAAVGSPLLEDINLENAKGVLVNITAGPDMKTGEIEEVLALVREFAAQDAIIIHGVAFDDSMGADIKVTIVATGLGGSASKKMPKNTFEFESVEPILPKPDISHSSREVKKVSSSDLMDSEYLDIPSFVKKQID